MSDRISVAPHAAPEATGAPSQPRRHLVSVPPMGRELPRNQALVDHHRLAPSYSRPPGSIDSAIRMVIREEVCAELRAALAEHREEERARDGTRLVPLVEAARRFGLTPKALRSRIERGSIDGAVKIGERWHLPVAAFKKPEHE